jgi:hypothetical protein
MEVLRDALLIGASDVAATHEDSLANRGVEPKTFHPSLAKLTLCQLNHNLAK